MAVAPLQLYSAAPTAPEVHQERPTNRLKVGIDKLEVTLPVERELPFHRRGGVKARVISVKDSRLLSISCNPSRLLMPMSGQLCSTSRLGEALEALLHELPYEERDVSLESLRRAKLTRLDVARDFEGVWHLSQILDGLRLLPPPKGMTARAFGDSRIESGWNGLTWGKNSRVTIYDKRQRRPRFCTSGEARFEVRARQEWLDPHGMRRVDEVTEVRAMHLLLRKWAEVGAGTTIFREQDWVDRVLSRPDWSPVVAGRFLYDHFSLLRKRPLRGSGAHRRNFRARLAEIGVGIPLDDVVSLRLDLRSGTEVVTS